MLTGLSVTYILLARPTGVEHTTITLQRTLCERTRSAKDLSTCYTSTTTIGYPMKNTPSTRHNAQPKTWQKRLRLTTLWVAAVVASLVAVLLLCLVLRATIANQHSANLKKELATQTKDARTSGIADSDVTHRQILTLLTDATTLNNEPVYSVVYDTCYSDHNDSGWFPVSYNYRCRVSYVDIFETEISPALQTRVASRTDDYDSSNTNLWDMYFPVSVEDLAKPTVPLGNRDLDIRDASRLKAAVPLPIPSIDIRELANSKAIVFSSVVAYAANEAHAHKTLVSEHSGGDFDPAKTYVIVSWDNEYFKRDIGCAFGKVILCRSPLKPVDVF